MGSNKGYTIIEVLLAMLIGSLIIVIAISVASKYMQSAQIKELERNAAHVLSALDAYYEENCSSGTTAQPSISTLISRGYLESTRFTKNPFGNDLQVRMLWGTPTRLRVATQMTSHSRIGGSVGADRIVGSTLFWERLPTLLTNDFSQEIMEHKHLHEPGVCR